MGLWARVLTAGAAVLVASPAFAHCHFSRSGDCVVMAVAFDDAWNLSAGYVLDTAPSAPRTAALRHGADAMVVRAALRAEAPERPARPRRELWELFTGEGRLLDYAGTAWSHDEMKTFGKRGERPRYEICESSINATDLGEKVDRAVVEWTGTVVLHDRRIPHRVFAVLVRPDPAKRNEWKFDSVVMIPDDAPSTLSEKKH